MQSGIALSVPAICLLFLAGGCAPQPDPTPETPPEEITQGARLQLLENFANAWNRHDIDAILAMMTTDCVFDASGGPAVNGTHYEGQEAVRAAFQQVFDTYPDAQWAGARHFVAGDRGVSEWTFSGTRADGSRLEVHGCDLFTFRDGKIAVKNSYRKNRPPIPAGGQP
jgi:taurine dehydrogenase small subunit